MTSAAHGSTKPAPGVTTTRPATRPVLAPTSVGRPVCTRSTASHETMPAALAVTVLRMASAATASALNSLPPLKPNQPNQSKPAPSATNGTLCGR